MAFCTGPISRRSLVIVIESKRVLLACPPMVHPMAADKSHFVDGLKKINPLPESTLADNDRARVFVGRQKLKARYPSRSLRAQAWIFQPEGEAEDDNRPRRSLCLTPTFCTCVAHLDRYHRFNASRSGSRVFCALATVYFCLAVEFTASRKYSLSPHIRPCPAAQRGGRHQWAYVRRIYLFR